MLQKLSSAAGPHDGRKLSRANVHRDDSAQCMDFRFAQRIRLAHLAHAHEGNIGATLGTGPMRYGLRGRHRLLAPLPTAHGWGRSSFGRRRSRHQFFSGLEVAGRHCCESVVRESNMYLDRL